MRDKSMKLVIIDFPRRLYFVSILLVQVGIWLGVVTLFLESLSSIWSKSALVGAIVLFSLGLLFDFVVSIKTKEVGHLKVSGDRVLIEIEELKSANEIGIKAFSVSFGWAADDFYSLPIFNLQFFTMKMGLHVLKFEVLHENDPRRISILIKSKEQKKELRELMKQSHE